MRSNFCRVTWSARSGHMIIFPVEDTYIRKGSASSTQTAWFTRFGKTGHEVCTSECPNSTHPFTRSKQPIPGSNWHQFCMQALHHPQALRVVSSWPCAPSIYCIVFLSVRHQQPPLAPCMQRHCKRGRPMSQAAILTQDFYGTTSLHERD